MLELKSISYAVREGDSELGILNNISLTIPDHRLVRSEERRVGTECRL